METQTKKRGRPRKAKEVIENGMQEERQEGQTVTTAEVPNGMTVVITEPEPIRFKENPPQSDVDRIAESRKALSQVLPPGQKFFETPDGEIIIGEESKNEVWSRRLNAWINPRR